MDRQEDGQTGECMDRWMDGLVNVYVCMCVCVCVCVCVYYICRHVCMYILCVDV
jgi:hypothetical protein